MSTPVPIEYLEVLDRDVVSLSTLEESRALLRHLIKMAEEHGSIVLEGRTRGGPVVCVAGRRQPQRDWHEAIEIAAHTSGQSDLAREARATMSTLPDDDREAES